MGRPKPMPKNGPVTSKRGRIREQGGKIKKTCKS